MNDDDDNDDIVRLLGCDGDGDEEGWFIADERVDPLGRTWTTAQDAMAEVPGEWWEEEPGVWMCVRDELGERQ